MLDKNIIRVMAVEEPALGTEVAMAALADRPSLALLLKKQPDKEGDVIGTCDENSEQFLSNSWLFFGEDL